MSENKNEAFVWPEFRSDRDRIKEYSRRFKTASIAESFSQVYDIDVQETEAYVAMEYSNTHPVAIGDVIEVVIESIGKREATVSYNNSKESLVIKGNTATWNVSTGDTIKGTVVKKDNNYYVVDPIDTLYREWIDKVTSTLSNTFQSYVVEVKDLIKLNYGYRGKIEIPEITELIGKPYYINAMIPGSQITLNIERDFDQWTGKSVDAMVTNFTNSGGEFCVVCSRKKYLNVNGGMSLVNIYDMGYINTPFTQMTFEGTVTGIINSAKKQGVFVEIPTYNITGMIEKNPQDLVNYRIGDKATVMISRLDWDQRRSPYRKNKDGVLTEVNIKPVFVEVEIVNQAKDQSKN